MEDVPLPEMLVGQESEALATTLYASDFLSQFADVLHLHQAISFQQLHVSACLFVRCCYLSAGPALADVSIVVGLQPGMLLQCSIVAWPLCYVWHESPSQARLASNASDAQSMHAMQEMLTAAPAPSSDSPQSALWLIFRSLLAFILEVCAQVSCNAAS